MTVGGVVWIVCVISVCVLFGFCKCGTSDSCGCCIICKGKLGPLGPFCCPCCGIPDPGEDQEALQVNRAGLFGESKVEKVEREKKLEEENRAKEQKNAKKNKFARLREKAKQNNLPNDVEMSNPMHTS